MSHGQSRESLSQAYLDPDHAPSSEPDPDQSGRVILVGVGFGPPSRVALRRAQALGQALGCKLRLVHAVPESSSAEQMVPPFVSLPITDPAPETSTDPSTGLHDWTERLQVTVQAWAAFLAGVMIPTAQICVVRGDPCEVLKREAARPDVELVVLGRGERLGSELRPTLPNRLLRCCPRPMLVVGERGLHPVIVAATDCVDERLPVLRAASSRVPALGEKVIAVHNLDAHASQLAALIDRPMTPQVAAMLCTRVQEWLDESRSAHRLLLTNHTDNAAGVLSAARSQQADLLVVGVKGGTERERGTAEVLLQACPVSILFVPLGRGPAHHSRRPLEATTQILRSAGEPPAAGIAGEAAGAL